MTINEIMTTTLAKMPASFSSRQFNKVALRNGATKTMVDNGTTTNFLRTNLDQIGPRSWNKKATLFTQKEDGVQEAIKLLKAAGYKIYKTVQQEV